MKSWAMKRTPGTAPGAQPIEKGQKVLCLFGSEGGFERDENQKLQDAGFRSCSLGPRNLRAETAPIYFLSAVSYATELAQS